jgi:hypothetical protein
MTDTDDLRPLSIRQWEMLSLAARQHREKLGQDAERERRRNGGAVVSAKAADRCQSRPMAPRGSRARAETVLRTRRGVLAASRSSREQAMTDDCTAPSCASCCARLGNVLPHSEHPPLLSYPIWREDLSAERAPEEIEEIALASTSVALKELLTSRFRTCWPRTTARHRSVRRLPKSSYG